MIGAPVQGQVPRMGALAGDRVLAIGVEEIELGLDGVGGIDPGRGLAQVGMAGLAVGLAQGTVMVPGGQAEARFHYDPTEVLDTPADGAHRMYSGGTTIEEMKDAPNAVDTEAEWGGAVELTDGSKWYIDPISPRPGLPTTLRFKRGD